MIQVARLRRGLRQVRRTGRQFVASARDQDEDNAGLLVDLETHLNTEIGRRIRTQRHAAELTLKQLANRTGLSVSLISQIELGKSAASMSTMHKLGAALGVRMTYFFETL